MWTPLPQRKEREGFYLCKLWLIYNVSYIYSIFSQKLHLKMERYITDPCKNVYVSSSKFVLMSQFSCTVK